MGKHPIYKILLDVFYGLGAYTDTVTVRRLIHGRMLSFALLDYRVTNQIYLSVTQNTSSAILNQSDSLISIAGFESLALLVFRVDTDRKIWFVAV